LYGKGIEIFVPDKAYDHDFYSVANEIINDHQVQIKLTIEEDDICRPCKYIGKDGICKDNINHIDGVSSKDEWNKIIDKRIISYSRSIGNDIYSAYEYCEKLYSIREHIFDIWQEETDSAKVNRFDAFCFGAKKYLKI
jgi:hypothetical protein